MGYTCVCNEVKLIMILSVRKLFIFFAFIRVNPGTIFCTAVDTFLSIAAYTHSHGSFYGKIVLAMILLTLDKIRDKY